MREAESPVDVRLAMRALDQLGAPTELDGRELSLAERCQALAERPPVPELMGTKEAAAECGVSTSNLGQLKGLPEPVIDYLSRGGLWRADEIRAFAQQRKDNKT